MEFKGKLKSIDYKVTENSVEISFRTHQNDVFIQKLLTYMDKELNIKINEDSELRSNNQNSLLWKFIGKLGDKLNRPAIDIYRDYIRDYGIFRDYEMVNEAINTMVGSWEQNGIGWFTDIVDAGNEKSIVRFYYGSSCYGTKKFNKLIDAVLLDCEEQGIPTERE